MSYNRQQTEEVSRENFIYQMESGGIAKCQADFLWVTYWHQPRSFTAREALVEIQKFRPGVDLNSVSPVLAPLAKRNLIYKFEKRKCTVSKATAGAYRYCGGVIMPVPDKAKTHKERILECLQQYVTWDICRCTDPAIVAAGLKCLKCLSMQVIKNKR